MRNLDGSGPHSLCFQLFCKLLLQFPRQSGLCIRRTDYCSTSSKVNRRHRTIDLIYSDGSFRSNDLFVVILKLSVFVHIGA